MCFSLLLERQDFSALSIEVFLLIETMVERPSPLFLAGRFHLSKTMAKVAVAIRDFGAIRRILKAPSVYLLTGLFFSSRSRCRSGTFRHAKFSFGVVVQSTQLLQTLARKLVPGRMRN